MSAVPSKKDWIELIGESVHTSDDVDIGDIDAVSRDFVVVKRGFVNVHYYYVPLKKVEGWDGNVLWLKATEDQVKRSYERDTMPEPGRYFVKDYPAYTAIYPELATFTPRYTMSSKPLRSEQPVMLKCDLCGTSFRSEDELSAHVASKH
jgi:hypothetical protein